VAAVAALRARPAAPPAHVERLLVPLADGATTTVHVAQHALAHTSVRVVRLRPARALQAWCARQGVGDAIVGGFFVRADGAALGDLRTRGIARPSVPFAAPWAAVRACVQAHHGRVTIARRHELDLAPRGELLQAGPLLVQDGLPVARDGEDPEGFSAAAHQFDSDITAGRHPRAALALAGDRLLAVACDGRTAGDAGLTMGELSRLLVALGADHALNLDGGGSTSLVAGGALVNMPREGDGTPIAGGRRVVTALTFTQR
jgi:hypothetical protein